MISIKAKEWLKSHLTDVVKIKTTTQAIAAGFSVGTFVSILPEPGFSVFIAFIIVLIFKRISKIAIFVAMAFWNPVTLIPVYVASYELGRFLLKGVATEEYTMSVLNRVYYFSNDFLLGNLIVAVVLSIVFYGLTFAVVKLAKFRKAKKQEVFHHH
mgnify:CR=1 FL=1